MLDFRLSQRSASYNMYSVRSSPEVSRCFVKYCLLNFQGWRVSQWKEKNNSNRKPASWTFLLLLATHPLWRRRQYVPPKHEWTYCKNHPDALLVILHQSQSYIHSLPMRILCFSSFHISSVPVARDVNRTCEQVQTENVSQPRHQQEFLPSFHDPRDE
jgi:hypothetical protein